MAVRSRRLLSSSAVPNGTTGTTVTVDPDRTAIIKCFTAHNHSGVSTTVELQVRTSPTSIRRIGKWTLANDEHVIERELFVVATEGNTINVVRGAGTVSTTVSGALLDGDPA